MLSASKTLHVQSNISLPFHVFQHHPWRFFLTVSVPMLPSLVYFYTLFDFQEIQNVIFWNPFFAKKIAQTHK